jgi:hypothetical protein
MRDEEAEELLLDLHARIRARVRAAQAAAARRAEVAASDPARHEGRVAHPGAGDVSFGLDVDAEGAIVEFAEEFARREPLLVVSEGIGVRRFGASSGEVARRLVVDPIDGTRNLMFDLRSGWILSALAPERGVATRLSDVTIAVQSELPPRGRWCGDVLLARRGHGARLRRIELDTGTTLYEHPLRATADASLTPGFVAFFKFDRRERVAITAVEERFLSRLAAAEDVDATLLFDDQYISSAGQMHLLLTRRYRFVADLRGAIGDVLGIANQTSKPYDVCCALIAAEAGVPIVDLDGRALDLPLDLDARVTFAGYANGAVRARLEPLLRAAWAEVAPTLRGPAGGRAP